MSYRIRNWSEYNAGLKQRGSLTFWVDESVLESWIVPNLSGKPGASVLYSDLAIITMVTLKSIYGLAGRQCQGFVESIFELMGIDLFVPDHSTLSRRLGNLSIDLPVLPKAEAKHVVVDSTGVKVYGEGEWKTRQHGISKRRTWRKLHLGIDEQTGEILAAFVTTNDISDGQVLPELLNQIEGDIEQVSGDGATNGNATMPFETAKLRQPSHLDEEPKSGSMATLKESVTTEMRISGGFAKSGGKLGNNRATTIAVLWQKPPCFGSRPSLAGV
jgi:hypothetical protein